MNKYTELAKKAVDKHVKEGKTIELTEGLPSEMIRERAGVFVTIEKDGEFRACIGTFLPVEENIAEEIIRNAISAATEDYRLGPVAEKELPFLSYSVYILGEPELVKNREDLDSKKFGIIVRCDSMKTGLLLPDLEDIDTVDKQILVACEKAGINPEKDNFSIYRFEAVKHGN